MQRHHFKETSHFQSGEQRHWHNHRLPGGRRPGPREKRRPTAFVVDNETVQAQLREPGPTEQWLKPR